MVVSIHLQNISRVGSSPHIMMNIKNIWNHLIYIYINIITHPENQHFDAPKWRFLKMMSFSMSDFQGFEYSTLLLADGRIDAFTFFCMASTGHQTSSFRPRFISTAQVIGHLDANGDWVENGTKLVYSMLEHAQLDAKRNDLWSLIHGLVCFLRYKIQGAGCRFANNEEKPGTCRVWQWGCVSCL